MGAGRKHSEPVFKLTIDGSHNTWSGCLTSMLSTRLASTVNWFVKDCATCYHVHVVMHVKDPQLSVVGVGNPVPAAVFCLSLYSLLC